MAKVFKVTLMFRSNNPDFSFYGEAETQSQLLSRIMDMGYEVDNIYKIEITELSNSAIVKWN